MLALVLVAGGLRAAAGHSHGIAEPDADSGARQGRHAAGWRLDPERGRRLGGRPQPADPGRRRDATIWPAGGSRPDERVTIDVVVKRPGWISWLAGQTQTLHLTLTTPVASLRSHYLTVGGRRPAARCISRRRSRRTRYGHRGPPPAPRLAHARARVTLGRGAPTRARCSSPPRRARWESSQPGDGQLVPGRRAAATAVANPAPARTIKPTTPITLTFSKPRQQGARRAPAAGLADHAGELASAQQPRDRLPSRRATATGSAPR